MKHTIDGITYDFNIFPDIGYIRRTGDYDMEHATINNWDWDFDESGEDISDEVKVQLLAYWKDNYDPTP